MPIEDVSMSDVDQGGDAEQELEVDQGPDPSDADLESGDSDDDSEELPEDPSAGEDDEQQLPGDELDGEVEDGQPAKGQAPKATPTPPPPAGYASWDEVTREAQEARRLRAEWAQAQPYLKQAAMLIRQHQAQQQAQQQPERQSWAPPHLDNPAVRRAYEAVRLNPKAAETLPPDLRSKVQEADTYVQSKWDEYFMDPSRFVAEQVLPTLDGSEYAQRLFGLERTVQQLLGRDFLRANSGALQSPDDVRQLRELTAKGMTPDLAVEHLAMKRQLAALTSKQRKVDERARSQQVQQQRARAAQGTKRGQRPGRPSAGVFGTTDAREIYLRLKEQGRI